MNVTSLEKHLKSQRTPLARNQGELKPDWNAIPHKNMSALSKEEIFGQLRELAKQEAGTTDAEILKKLAEKRQELFVMYESFGSPDRKTLFDEALDVMKKNTAGFLQKAAKPAEKLDVFDFINKSDMRRAGFSVEEATLSRAGAQETEQTYELPSGGSLKAKSTLGRGMSMEIFRGREQVLSVQRDGSVRHNSTAEEKKLREEITDFYNLLRRNADAPPPASGRVLDTKA
jgi:hypothetical protein